MKKTNGCMDKKIVSLMCKKLNSQDQILTKIACEDPDKVIEYLHEKYRESQALYQNKFQYVLRK